MNSRNFKSMKKTAVEIEYPEKIFEKRKKHITKAEVVHVIHSPSANVRHCNNDFERRHHKK